MSQLKYLTVRFIKSTCFSISFNNTLDLVKQSNIKFFRMHQITVEGLVYQVDLLTHRPSKGPQKYDNSCLSIMDEITTIGLN